ncbi:IS1381, transposase OrfA [Streptococcus pneumoniae SP18-BS74]|nr:IS1381, transposase OrfA [Streptococcus pneumoniae SP18-BS74]
MHDLNVLLVFNARLFEEMLAVLKQLINLNTQKGGRKPKLSLEDLLMATLHYVREYRTYEEIAADFWYPRKQLTPSEPMG